MTRDDPRPRATAESVWDYPRPPRVEACARRLRVTYAGRVIAETRRGLRLLETSHPPTYYFPPADIDHALLRPGRGRSLCEFKGAARYWDLLGGAQRSPRAGWSYEDPWEPYAALAGHVAFYAGRVDAAYVDDERVRPQPGDFYGGWVTSHVVGPFKGGPGTRGW